MKLSSKADPDPIASKSCQDAAHHFLLSGDEAEACSIIDRVETAIRDNWDGVCEEAQLILRSSGM